MTVNSKKPISGPTIANGTNKDWPFDFKVTSAGHLYVYMTDNDGGNPETVKTNISVEEQYLNNDNGGYARYPASGDAVPAGRRLYVIREVPYTQPTRIGNQGGFFPETHEKAMDNLSMQIQQLLELQSRGLIVPPGEIPPTIDDIQQAQQYALDALAAAMEAIAAASSTQPELDSRAFAIANYHPIVAPNKVRTAGYSNPGDGGGALYKQAAMNVEPSHAGKLSITLADGVSVVWYEICESVVTPKMVGVVFNSAFDQAAGMVDWIGVLAALDVEGYIPAGVIKMNSGISSSKSGLTVRCHRKTVFDLADAPVGTYCITLSGTIGAYFLGTNGAYVVNTTRIRTGAGFANSLVVGDVIKIVSDNNYDASNTNSLYGETNVVVGLADAANGYIDIERPLSATYATNPRVAKITPIRDAVWESGKALGAIAEQNGQRGIRLANFKDCKILRFNAERMDDRAISVVDGLDFEVIPGNISDSRPGGTGYGVSVADAVNDGIIHHGTFQRIRHAFSTNNGANLYGVPRRITFADNIVSGGAWARTGSMGPGDGIDTHGAAEEIYIERNTITGCPGQGINFECRSGVIRDNKILGAANTGIAVHNESDLNGSIIVTGNKVSRAGNKGIYITNGSRGTTAFYEVLVCSGNVVDGSVAEGIQINYLSHPSKIRGAVISDNRVRLAGGVGIYVTNCRNLAVNDNSVEGIGTQQAMRIQDSVSFSVNDNNITQPNGGTSFGLQISASTAAATTLGEITGNVVNAYGGSFAQLGIALDNNVQYTGVNANNVRGSTGVSIGTGTGNSQANNTL